MGEHVLEGLEILGVVVAVHDALVHHGLGVHVLLVQDVAVLVHLVGVALGTEGQEYRQGAEVVDVVVHRGQAQGAQVRDDHGAVEGAHVQQLLGDPAVVVHDPQQADGGPEDEAGEVGHGLGKVLGAVIVVGGLDLLDLLVELAVHVKDGVRGLEDDLDGGLGGVDGELALDGHDHLDVVAGIDPPAHHEAVDARQHGDGPDMAGDEEVEQADALVALHPQGPEPPVHGADLHGLLAVHITVVALGHDEGDELVEGGQGAEQTAFLPVAVAAFICGVGHGRYLQKHQKSKVL